MRRHWVLPAAFHSVRFQLPAFLIAIGAVIYAGSLLAALQSTVATGLESREQAARGSLSAIARFIADLEARHDEESVREILAQIGAMSDVNSAAFVDGQGRVVAATRQDWIDLPVGETPWTEMDGIVTRMRASTRPVTDHDSYGLTLLAIPVHSGGLDLQGGPRGEGVLLAKLDFRPLVRTVRRETYRFFAYMAVCSLLAVVALIFFLQARVARPALRIAEAADRSASGDRTARTGLSGGDELSRAAMAFDRMAMQVNETESQLRREQAVLDGVLDALPVGVFAVDRATRTVMFANRRMTDLGGVPLRIGTRLENVEGSREHRAGKPFLPLEQPVERAMAEGAPVQVDDMIFVHPDGTRVPVVAVAHPMNLRGSTEFDSVIAVVQDRRDLERAFAEMKTWEERFQSASLATGQAVYEQDLEHDVCRFSHSLLEVFGWRPEELDSNAKWNGITHPDDLERVCGEFDACMRERRVFECTYRVHHRDGRWLWVRDRGVFRFDGERAVRMLGAVADVTEQRELETKLQQAQKMETVGTLAGGVAHDFNNQLTGVLGHLDLLGEDLAVDDPLQEHVRVARRAAERCAELTRGLLAFSRMLRTEVRAVDLNALVEETAALLRRVLPATIRLELAPDPEGLRAVADPTQLQQVVLNLCVNARDAMPAGGTLSVSTGRVVVPEDGAAGARGTPGMYACITVSDTGLGMTPEVQARIFEPFFTTKEVGAGTGLGLAMVYGIVAQHRGWVDVDSAPGRGSTFRVHVPAAGADGAIATRPEGRAPGSAARVPRLVMVVDDEPVVREYATRLLERAGCRVLGAQDGAEALAVLARHPGQVEAVLIDLTMPGPPVRDVLRTMRETEPGMRVVVTSGYSHEAVRLGEIAGLAFLPKPYTAPELIARICDRAPESDG